MTRSMNWILIVLGAVLILMEVLLGAVTGFDFLLIGSAILLGGLIGLISGSLAVGIAAAGVLSLAYVLVGRSWIRNRLRRPGLKSNTDALVGRVVVVSSRIVPDQPGRIKHEGDEWRALPENGVSVSMEAGERVRVTRFEGVTVFVVPAAAETASGGV